MTGTTRRFGDYDVTIVKDGIFETSTALLVHQGGEAKLRAAAGRFEGGKIRIDVNCFLLRGPGGLALVDAGTGTAWGEGLGHAQTALAAAGVAPEQIGRVLLTHLHGDHALGLLVGDAAWLPVAELLVPETDLAYFTDAAARATLPPERQAAFDIAAKVLAAYAGRIRTFPPGDVPGMPGISAMPLPGHTPGHTGYLFGGVEKLLICADTLHLRELQPADPELGLVFDIDPAAAVRTRLALLQQAERAGWTVAGNHIAGFGHIRRDGEAFRFVPVEEA